MCLELFFCMRFMFFQEKKPKKRFFLYKHTTIKNICGNFVPIFEDIKYEGAKFISILCQRKGATR